MTWTTLQMAMADQGYIASGDLAMALHLSLSLGRPLLLEGAAGVGKTEVARVLAAVQETQLIRFSLMNSCLNAPCSRRSAKTKPRFCLSTRLTAQMKNLRLICSKSYLNSK